MGMETTPLHKHPETRELIVNSDINTGNYNIITNDIMANNITVNNLTSNSITNTGDILTDTLHASGGITGTLYGEQVHVVECIPSATHYFTVDTYSTNDRNTVIILPFIPSTYYKGKIKLWANEASSSTIHNIVFYGVNNILSDYRYTDSTLSKIDIDIPDGTIGVIVNTFSQSSTTPFPATYAGFTCNYLPIPPQ